MNYLSRLFFCGLETEVHVEVLESHSAIAVEITVLGEDGKLVVLTFPEFWNRL